jgi:uncharacterized protein
MLVIDLSSIGPEGLDIDTPLVAGEVHVQGEDTFTLDSGRLKARVDRDPEASIHVKGHLEAQMKLECGRCLEPYLRPFDQNIDLFFLPHDKAQEGEEDEDEVQLSDTDLVVAYYSGDQLDLGDVVREQLFLSLPMSRVCQEACQGLCPTCGINRNRGKCDCVVTAETGDPRLAALKKLLEK